MVLTASAILLCGLAAGSSDRWVIPRVFRCCCIRIFWESFYWMLVIRSVTGMLISRRGWKVEEFLCADLGGIKVLALFRGSFRLTAVP